MSKRKKKRSKSTPFSPAARALIALAAPLATAVIVAGFVGFRLEGTQPFGSAAPVLAAIGVVSWVLGVRWYGIGGTGVRGRQALFAGIGFASLVWLLFFAARFLFVSTEALRSPDATRIYFYLLLFEAFAVQLWSFGLVFRALADWRGPLPAMVGSGILFGLIAYLLFQESFVENMSALLYFGVWGVLYGVIRLRTGSWVGVALVQPVHTFTSWFVLVPPIPPEVAQLQNVYLTVSVAYLVLIWRLWPKQEIDYRV